MYVVLIRLIQYASTCEYLVLDARNQVIVKDHRVSKLNSRELRATTLVCLTIYFQLPLQNLTNVRLLVANAVRRVIVVGVGVALKEYAELKDASKGINVAIDIQIAAATSA